MKNIATIGGILCASVLAMNADEASQKKRIEQELRQVPILELPARAAEVVRLTPASERSQAAIIAVETVVSRNPAVATTVISAIAKATPEAGAAAAGAAARLQPGNAEQIESAGRAAAPTHGSEIASAVRSSRAEEKGGNGEPAEGGNGHALGGVGRGPGPDKPGAQVDVPRPGSLILPNGKVRNLPPNPPRRPVTPPRPHHYNRPASN